MVCTHLAVHGLKTVFTEKIRSLWVVLGLALGIGLYVTITLLSNGYAQLVTLPFTRLNTDLIIQRPVQGMENRPEQTAGSGIRLPFSNQPVSEVEIDQVEGLDSVEGVSRAVMLWFQEKNEFSVIAGVELADSTGPARVLSWINKGRSLSGRGDIVVESHYARFHKIRIGQKISFHDYFFTVVGIAEIRQGASVAAANYYITIADARIMAAMPTGSSNMLFVRLKKGQDAETVQTRLQTVVPGTVSSTVDNIGSMLKGFAGISQRVSRILGAVSLAFAALLGSWLIGGALQERAGRIGLLKTIGWQRRDILVAIGTETLLLGLFGALCGLGLGYLAAMIVGLQEVSLVVPWNLAVKAGAMQHDAQGTVSQVALPISMGLKTWLIGLVTGCLFPLATGLVVAGKMAGSRVKTVFTDL